jgi:undecaprenyl-diphosphatase
MTTLEFLDQKLFFFINHSLSNSPFDVIMPFVTDNAITFILPVIVYMVWREGKKAALAIFLTLLALTFSDGVTNVLKHYFERPRPFIQISDVLKLVGSGSSYSMPSGHAANVLSVATVLTYSVLQSRNLRRRALLICYLAVVGLAVSFSRIYVGVHYPSDVLVGNGVGILIGVLVVGSLYPVKKAHAKAPYATALGISLLFLSLFRMYYILSGSINLSPDEAHYWDWSRRLDLSYYSKGPAIAYFIAMGTFIFGDTEFGVRVLAVIFSVLSSLVLYMFGREVARENETDNSQVPEIVGLASALSLQLIPLFSTYGIIMTIDSPLIFFWSFSLYLFWRAMKGLSFLFFCFPLYHDEQIAEESDYQTSSLACVSHEYNDFFAHYYLELSTRLGHFPPFGWTGTPSGRLQNHSSIVC